MLSHQRVELFERVRRYGLVEINASLGYDASKAHAIPSLSPPSLWIRMQLSAAAQTCCHVPHYDDNALDL